VGQNNFPPSAEMKIRELEQRIKQLEASSQTRVPIDTITGGALQVQDAAGNTYVYIGRQGVSWPDGSPQYGMRIVRQDGPESVGTVAFDFFTDDPANAAQTLNMYDASGNLVYGDDALSQFGLAAPYIPMPLFRSDAANWPATTSATMTDMFFGWPTVQHPKITVWGLMNAPSGTTAQIQVISNTTVLGAGPLTVPGASSGPTVWQVGPAPFASAVGASIRDFTDLRVQACRTAGTGTVQVAVGLCVGVQS
jgi:hypothetical protein